MKIHRDYKALVEAAEAAGWTLDETAKKHPRLSPPAGKTGHDGRLLAPVILPSTPSDKRAFLNARSALRRAGVDV
jgi:hypothetical protein